MTGRQRIEAKLGYHFKDLKIIERALTHRSYSNEKNASRKSAKPMENNERLEFLGDAVLDLIISELLLEIYPDFEEGALSKALASLVNEKSLATLARSIDLGANLILGKGEKQSGGQNKDSILADAYEAVMAAIYLDSGLKSTARIVRRQFLTLIDNETKPFIDYKTALQEFVQQRSRSVPVYRVISQTGKDHDKEFEIHVFINQEMMGKGCGRNKKTAEQRAAEVALVNVRKNESPINETK